MSYFGLLLEKFVFETVNTNLRDGSRDFEKGRRSMSATMIGQRRKF